MGIHLDKVEDWVSWAKDNLPNNLQQAGDEDNLGPLEDDLRRTSSGWLVEADNRNLDDDEVKILLSERMSEMEQE